MTRWVKAFTGKRLVSSEKLNHLTVMEPLIPEKTTLKPPVVVGLKMTLNCV